MYAWYKLYCRHGISWYNTLVQYITTNGAPIFFGETFTCKRERGGGARALLNPPLLKLSCIPYHDCCY